MMDRFPITIRWPYAITGVGILFAGLQLGELILIAIDPTLVVQGYIVGAITGFPFLVALVYGGYWLLDRGFSPRQYKRITGWCLTGATGFTALITGIVFVTETPTILFLTSTVRWAGSIGGTIGMVIGIFAARGQALARQRDRFETLFETLPEPVVLVTGPDPVTATIARVNPAFEETFGYDEADVIDENLNDIIVPEDKREEAEQINRQHLAREDGLAPREVRRQTAGGELRDFLLLITTFSEYKRENLWEGFAIYADITERKERERRLDEFVGIVSHDLRNPLNVAKGRLRLATEEYESEHFDAANRALDRMATLIEDLLTLARQGDTAIEIEPVELSAIAESRWETVRTAEATLVVNTDARINADRARLSQLLENLFRNAVEHGGTDVTVTLGELEDGFYIADDGPGIPEEHCEDVFESGYTTNKEGTGFGLAIVKEIVETHEWEIEIAESTDGGARFEIRGVDIAS